MTAPRHLWSGDWRRESAAAAEERARREAPSEAPPATPRPSPSKPPTRSGAARALARVRRLRPRGAVLLALAILLGAGAGYAAVSSLVGSGGGGSETGKASVASSPARTTAPAWLGVQTINFPPADGVMVVDVVPGSPADLAGLQPGDVITQIGNRPVQAPTDLDSALAGMHAGQRIEIQYARGPMSYTTQATLRARPANGP